MKVNKLVYFIFILFAYLQGNCQRFCDYTEYDFLKQSFYINSKYHKTLIYSLDKSAIIFEANYDENEELIKYNNYEEFLAEAFDCNSRADYSNEYNTEGVLIKRHVINKIDNDDGYFEYYSYNTNGEIQIIKNNIDELSFKFENGLIKQIESNLRKVKINYLDKKISEIRVCVEKIRCMDNQESYFFYYNDQNMIEKIEFADGYVKYLYSYDQNHRIKKLLVYRNDSKIADYEYEYKGVYTLIYEKYFNISSSRNLIMYKEVTR
ncbi:hypothetical protein [Psychroserpens algicola]|uniref:YD repeat-containing protein n=1 Tax=Psychroserpens algicola TaxID=1719034 RepID=A0ABT0HCW0_9FLAO|nr:hypothetical protein [Psychroserpens algicola]MCK8482198.1 hypothetical protein [Psychroserpens algicola]